MLDDKTYDRFKYFLECYFNPSAYYSELDDLIKEFNTIEPEINKSRLKQELKKLILNENINDTKEFIRKFGMRNMPIEKVKWFIEYLDSNITEK
jgi:predicted Ser/Thr protein kinase